MPAEDVVTPASENNFAVRVRAHRVVDLTHAYLQSTSAVAPEEQDDPVGTSSHPKTPDLVLPEDVGVTLTIELSSQDADQHVSHDKRLRSADSMDECDALLTVPAVRESEVGGRCLEIIFAHVRQPEAVPVGSIVSSRTASSTSLPPPRVRSRASGSSSKGRSPSRTTSSVDPLDLLPRPAPVPDQAETSSFDVSDILCRLKQLRGRPAPVPDQAKDKSASENHGGYRIITWASHVAEQRERPAEYKLAKDLPHSLQDWMNTLPATFRNSDVGCRIFEAHIQEAMNNEPDSPPIEVFDNNIGDEVTPRWEFHYTNEMWYGEGVSPPDVKHLKSCGCIGRCDPKSKTCACAQRQLNWVRGYIDGEIIPPTWSGSPFVYDHKGQLQRLECPIFECNRFCDCDEDCPNRVRTLHT